jgi:hypothetical protein
MRQSIFVDLLKKAGAKSIRNNKWPPDDELRNRVSGFYLCSSAFIRVKKLPRYIPACSSSPLRYTKNLRLVTWVIDVVFPLDKRRRR